MSSSHGWNLRSQRQTGNDMQLEWRGGHVAKTPKAALKREPLHRRQANNRNPSYTGVRPAFLNADNCMFEKELWSHFVQVMYSERWREVGRTVRSRMSRSEGAERRKRATFVSLHQGEPQTPEFVLHEHQPV